MFIVSFFVSFFAIAPVADTTIVNEQWLTATSNSSVNKTLLLQLVNDARKKGCECGTTWYPSAPALAWNDQLENAASAHSTDMSRKKYFSHTSQSGLGAGPRITTAGYAWRAYGENIAMGYADEKEVVTGWLKSPGHCSNIMNKDYKEMGAANVGGYWTQDFGTRR